jgi:hypothetical protein
VRASSLIRSVARVAASISTPESAYEMGFVMCFHEMQNKSRRGNAPAVFERGRASLCPLPYLFFLSSAFSKLTFTFVRLPPYADAVVDRSRHKR